MQLLVGKSIGVAASLIATSFVALTAAAGEAQHVREYFYVGGEYITTSAGSLYQNQMYVEKLTPPKVSQKYPIVFLHGGAQTGTVSDLAHYFNIQSSLSLVWRFNC
jgi:hypothetical protein